MIPRWFNKPVAGFFFYDFGNSAFATSVLAVIFSRYFAEVIAGGQAGTPINLGFTIVQIPGSAMWNYLVSFSMAVVAITSPVMGAMADMAGWRKKFLVIYCYFGVACTCGLIFAREDAVILASILFLGANFGFSGGNVFYNAFLPGLGKEDTYGRISGYAWGFGYLGGGLCLVLNLIMLRNPELIGFAPGSFTVLDCIFVAGLWWGIFALPAMFWLKDPIRSEQKPSIFRLTQAGWREVKETLGHVRRYRQLFRFLIAYLIFNDGIETVIVTASIFGAEVVGMETSEMIAYFIMIQATAFVGSFIFGWLADVIGSKRTLLITLVVWIFIVAWAYRLGWMFDLKTDYYLLGILAGLVLGGSQASARSLQSLFTPETHTAQFFGFFSFSGRFANVFGTAIYGTAIILTGALQTAILALGAFFLIGGTILFFVNEKEGAEAAGHHLKEPNVC